MNIYHAFLSLKPEVADMAFVAALDDDLGHLKTRGNIAGWRLMRRKLGLGPRELRDFHLMIELEELAQLDSAFLHVATRTGDVEATHHCVNHMVADVTFALYRDFPDPVREQGGELF